MELSPLLSLRQTVRQQQVPLTTLTMMFPPLIMKGRLEQLATLQLQVPRTQQELATLQLQVPRTQQELATLQLQVPRTQLELPTQQLQVPRTQLELPPQQLLVLLIQQEVLTQLLQQLHQLQTPPRTTQVTE